jgi:hypothetical protein
MANFAHRSCDENVFPIHQGGATPSPVRALISLTAADEIREDGPYDLPGKNLTSASPAIKSGAQMRN